MDDGKDDDDGEEKEEENDDDDDNEEEKEEEDEDREEEELCMGVLSLSAERGRGEDGSDGTNEGVSDVLVEEDDDEGG